MGEFMDSVNNKTNAPDRLKEGEFTLKMEYDPDPSRWAAKMKGEGYYLATFVGSNGKGTKRIPIQIVKIPPVEGRPDEVVAFRCGSTKTYPLHHFESFVSLDDPQVHTITFDPSETSIGYKYTYEAHLVTIDSIPVLCPCEESTSAEVKITIESHQEDGQANGSSPSPEDEERNEGEGEKSKSV